MTGHMTQKPTEPQAANVADKPKTPAASKHWWASDHCSWWKKLPAVGKIVAGIVALVGIGVSIATYTDRFTTDEQFQAHIKSEGNRRTQVQELSERQTKTEEQLRGVETTLGGVREDVGRLVDYILANPPHRQGEQ